MMTRFTKLALSVATAASLAVTPIPATAGPDGEDIARALAGLAVLGIVASAVNNRDKKRKQQAATSNLPLGTYGSIDNHRGNRIIHGDLRRPGHGSRQSVKQKRLPDQCLLIVDTNRGARYVYGNRCLNRNYQYAGQLPRNCLREVRTSRGVRTVYGARCLASDGWRVAQR